MCSMNQTKAAVRCTSRRRTGTGWLVAEPDRKHGRFATRSRSAASLGRRSHSRHRACTGGRRVAISGVPRRRKGVVLSVAPAHHTAAALHAARMNLGGNLLPLSRSAKSPMRPPRPIVPRKQLLFAGTKKHKKQKRMAALKKAAVSLYASSYIQTTRLDIEVLHVECVVFDELAACFDILAHQGREDRLGLRDIFELDLEQGTALGIHGGFP
jgi:hypothetical protein